MPYLMAQLSINSLPPLLLHPLLLIFPCYFNGIGQGETNTWPVFTMRSDIVFSDLHFLHNNDVSWDSVA